jgi:hypothetical protein
MTFKTRSKFIHVPLDFLPHVLNYSQLFLLNGARAVMRLTARASAAAKRAQASEAVGWKRMLGGTC